MWQFSLARHFPCLPSRKTRPRRRATVEGALLGQVFSEWPTPQLRKPPSIFRGPIGGSKLSALCTPRQWECSSGGANTSSSFGRGMQLLEGGASRKINEGFSRVTITRVESCRVRGHSKYHGLCRVGSGQEGFESNGTGRVTLAQPDPRRVPRPIKSPGKNEVGLYIP